MNKTRSSGGIKMEAPITDYTNYKHNITYRNKHKLAPQWPFRLIICGPSGCGKTNLLLNLIYDYLHFNKLYLYAKMLDEDKYQELQEVFEAMQEHAYKKYGEDVDELAVFHSSLDEVEPIDDLDENKQNLVVFDDFINEKSQTAVYDYFTMGRKKNCSVIYISHSYFDTPKIIRINSNYVAIFNFQNKSEISLFKKEFSLGISNEEFQRKYQDIVNKPHNFLLIDKGNSDPELKYRRNLDNKIR